MICSEHGNIDSRDQGGCWKCYLDDYREIQKKSLAFELALIDIKLISQSADSENSLSALLRIVEAVEEVLT